MPFDTGLMRVEKNLHDGIWAGFLNAGVGLLDIGSCDLDVCVINYVERLESKMGENAASSHMGENAASSHKV